MLSYKESLKILKETNALIEGHFILSSGLHSPKYIQCAQLLSKPEKAKKICESLAEKIKKEMAGTFCLRISLGMELPGHAYYLCNPNRSGKICLLPRSLGSQRIL